MNRSRVVVLFAALLTLSATPVLHAQHASMRSPQTPAVPLHVTGYLASAQRGDYRTPMLGFQIEYRPGTVLYPFAGFLRGNFTDQLASGDPTSLGVFEFGTGTTRHIGRQSISVGGGFALYNINTARAFIKASVDVPLSKVVGARLEVRNYVRADHWTFAVGVTVPPIRRK